MQAKLTLLSIILLVYGCSSDKIENGTKTVYFNGTEIVSKCSTTIVI
ncbi:MAG: hypothetical protein J0L69_01235 [Bacteroidetes bacterium]|nr:hypothetical protein [Bacteroidota bacterium]